jgi:hypothetical protein
MSDCSRSPLEWVSLVTGFASIGCFVFVQAPQIIKNFRQVRVWGNFCLLTGSYLSLSLSLRAMQMVWQSSFFSFGCVVTSAISLALSSQRNHSHRWRQHFNTHTHTHTHPHTHTSANSSLPHSLFSLSLFSLSLSLSLSLGLSLQILLAIWFCFADLTLFTQALYYQRLRYILFGGNNSAYEEVYEDIKGVGGGGGEGGEGESAPVHRGDSDRQYYTHTDRTSRTSRSGPASTSPAINSLLPLSPASSSSLFSPSPFAPHRSLLSRIAPSLSLSSLSSLSLLALSIHRAEGKCDEDSDTESQGGTRSVGYEIGLAFAFVSAGMYLASRLPQLYKNYRKGSTEGLSLLMFFMSILGNLLYGVSILTNPEELTHYKTELPFLLGSLGTMCLDLSIFAQFMWYRRQPTEYVELRD